MVDIIDPKWSELDASNNSAAPDGIQGNYAPSTVAPILRGTRAGVKRFYNRINAIYTATGSAAALALTFAQAPSGYSKGERIAFFPNATNTGAMTLNINSMGAKSILSADGTPLNAGDITSGQFTEVVHDGSAFRLVTGSGQKFTGTITAGGFSTNGTVTGTTLAGTHTGNGAALTALNASNIATGTIADARLPVSMAGKTFVGDTAVTTTLYVGAQSTGAAIELGNTTGTSGPAVIDFHTSATAVDYNARIIATGNTANGAGVLDIISGTLSHNGQEVWDKGMLPTPAVQATQVIAGNGLSGGGTIAANRTITLGTPGTITNGTTNSVTTTSHTHALTLVAADITGTLGYTPANIASPAFTGTPTAPTQAAGNNSTRLATTAFVTSAISASSDVFQSGNQTYTINALGSVAHGLGAKPNWYIAEMVCTVAANGWAVGDTFDQASCMQPWAGQGSFGILVWATATTINWKVGGNGIGILSKSNGGSEIAPMANWALRFRAGF